MFSLLLKNVRAGGCMTQDRQRERMLL